MHIILGYNNIKEEAIALSVKWGIKPEFGYKRQVKIKRYFDELSSDYQFNSREEKFKTTVFYLTIDLACQQLDRRFKGMYAIEQSFNILEPKIILHKNKEKELNWPRAFVKPSSFGNRETKGLKN